MGDEPDTEVRVTPPYNRKMAALPSPFVQPAYDHKRYFFETLGLSERLLERCLGEALSAGGEFADLYFEAVTSTSLGMDEGIVKTASEGISVGCGVRVLSASARASP